ncbi:hypothetical protein [Heliothis virescens ascovirus 3j]|uniref:Uncharacterized protein n=1 Tax=Heliothis virescens ascovirus 3j TaxID=1561067 RepID=A0A2Z5V8N4_9VIRU|nr:hypothetical protein [Heliothis virescens ascovirus 3j]
MQVFVLFSSFFPFFTTPTTHGEYRHRFVSAAHLTGKGVNFSRFAAATLQRTINHLRIFNDREKARLFEYVFGEAR